MDNAYPTELERFRFGDWISGFTDGEGCFLLRSDRSRDKRLAWKRWIGHRAQFTITLRIDDAAIIRKIREYFNCGVMALNRAYTHTANRNANPQARFSVGNTKELVKFIIPHFDEHPLLAKKARDYLIWREGVLLIWSVISRKIRSDGGKRFSSWTDSESKKFKQLAAELVEIRKYSEEEVRPLLRSPSPPPQPSLFDSLHA